MGQLDALAEALGERQGAHSGYQGKRILTAHVFPFVHCSIYYVAVQHGKIEEQQDGFRKD